MWFIAKASNSMHSLVDNAEQRIEFFDDKLAASPAILQHLHDAYAPQRQRARTAAPADLKPVAIRSTSKNSRTPVPRLRKSVTPPARNIKLLRTLVHVLRQPLEQIDNVATQWFYYTVNGRICNRREHESLRK